MYNFLLYSSQLPDSLFRSFSLFSTVFFIFYCSMKFSLKIKISQSTQNCDDTSANASNGNDVNR